MARKPKGYWEKRQTELLKQLEKATEPTINDLIKIYNKATENINNEIRNIFKNYSKNSTLDKRVLEQLFNKKETETYQKNLLKTINTIKDKELKQKLITKYNAPAYSYRISRLQALQDNIDIELKKIAELEEEVTKLRYVDTIDEAYYHNIYDIQKGTGYGFSFSQLDTRTMDMLLKQKWIGNANFSQRIWENSDKLNQFLKINFTADMMTGKSIQKMSKELSEYMNVGLYNATRLVRTEVNHFANASEMLAYDECGIDKYEFTATLDNVTCGRCANLDKKVFKVKEARQGINCPPLHPNDRCTTVAYFGDEEIGELQRRARDENNNNILVPTDMSYNEWYKKYVVKGFNDSNYINNLTGKSYGNTKFITKDIEDICYNLHKEAKKNSYENIVLIDKSNGKQKGKISTKGKSKYVRFSIEQQNLIQMSKDRSLIVVHNHPSNSTFSVNDIYNMVENKKISGIIVTTDDFYYFLSADEDILNITRKNIDDFKKWFEGTIKKSILENNNTKIDNEIYSNIYKNIFDTLGWNYGRKKR